LRKSNETTFVHCNIFYQYQSGFSQGIDKTRKSDNVLVAWAKRAQQGSNLKIWMSNQAVLGIQAWDGSPPADECRNPGLGCSYPSGACIEHLYGAGPIVASLVNGIPSLRKVIMEIQDMVILSLHKKILHVIDFGLPRMILLPQQTERDWMTIMTISLMKMNLMV